MKLSSECPWREDDAGENVGLAISHQHRPAEYAMSGLWLLDRGPVQAEFDAVEQAHQQVGEQDYLSRFGWIRVVDSSV